MENTYKAMEIVKTRDEEGLSQNGDNENAKESMNLTVIQKEE